MAGISVDGRRLAQNAGDGPATPSHLSTSETGPLGTLYLLMRRLGRRAGAPPRSAAAERAVGAP
jgi:hypothetical protein